MRAGLRVLKTCFEAFSRKLQTYEPIRTALQKYTASGWTVLVLPWVVGTRGFVHEQSLHGALKFFDIPHKQWSSIVQDSVRASVEALAFMCRLRFCPSLKKRTFDTDEPQSYLTMHASRSKIWQKTQTIWEISNINFPTLVYNSIFQSLLSRLGTLGAERWNKLLLDSVLISL